MKKLIVLSVVLALIAGSAFAVDVTGTVFGHVNVVQGDTGKDAAGDANPITSSGGMDRVRLDGSGANDDGTFGGYIRYQGGNVGVDSANVWWKPIDQFKLLIGNNSDGIWGKEGVTGWMFNQMPYDSGVALNPGTWFGSWGGGGVYGNIPYMYSRYTFFEGVTVDQNMALLEITPMDMFGINIAIPFFNGGRKDGAPSKEIAAVLQGSVVQINLNLDFGNIAIAYAGSGRSAWVENDAGAPEAGGAIFAYFGGTFGDLGLDVGLSYHLTDSDVADVKHPLGIGAGIKYATDSFGVKFKVTAALAGDDEATYINAAVNPYFTLSDSMSVFINAGLGMMMPSEGDSIVGWYFNPYLRVGAEWGPTFYAGIQVSSPGKVAGADAIISWAVPVSLMISF